MILPEARNHEVFENTFIDWCHERGLNVLDLSYHNHLPEREANKLRSNYFPTTLQYRTSPDFLVLNKNMSTYVELKTGNMKDKICLEAFPLMINQIHEKILNIPCLYIYRGNATKWIEKCCYSSQIKPIRLVIPLNRSKNDKIKNMLKGYFSGIEIIEKNVSDKFSGDAFIEVEAEEVNKWKSLDEVI